MSADKFFLQEFRDNKIRGGGIIRSLRFTKAQLPFTMNHMVRYNDRGN